MTGIHLVPVVLDVGAGERRTLQLPLPAGPTTFPEVLPAVRLVADALLGRAHAELENLGRAISCGKGCSRCCRYPVILGHPEALRLAQVAGALPEPRKAEVARRFRQGLARLEEAGLLGELVRVFALGVPGGAELARVTESYWRLDIPCPFLEGSECGIYEERPLVCRQYGVTTPPAACADPYGAGGYLEKVLVPVDLAGAAAAFDGSLATSSRVLPHLFSLFRAHDLRRFRYPRLPALVILTRFLDFAQMCYSRKE